VTAVAVWNHRPAAAELLEARLAAGWKPMATELKSGSTVLGYAACVFNNPSVISHRRTPDS